MINILYKVLFRTVFIACNWMNCSKDKTFLTAVGKHKYFVYGE